MIRINKSAFDQVPDDVRLAYDRHPLAVVAEVLFVIFSAAAGVGITAVIFGLLVPDTSMTVFGTLSMMVAVIVAVNARALRDRASRAALLECDYDLSKVEGFKP
ncbi:hypothetical protein BB737_08535 [Mycobacterium avium subsp. hominissuis]|uniref:Uncharacterized protein n=2 Tax=Mycobacterium TaxID=1763 RepID=A0AA37V3V2_9MYCO|nr:MULTISPECIES: hypothetical protein [Mycobacterium]PBJ37159.1 hypothetical protein XV03_07855 [Mycobacterium avium subsp. hominissuis]PBJ66260.1 hypothetical protein BB737_08535 [Mycobacterium avium subsp. hominissuis]QLI58534.1 hypothetical protein KV38_26870 [Mycobacterium avium subsp. hominissuis]GLB85712.1 hypothetical protein SRL2020028_49680 [Mycobacterium kiyosense]